MTNWIVYWAFFDKEFDRRPVASWEISKGNPLSKAVKGDRLWLITSGTKAKKVMDNCIPHAGYLAEVLTVDQILPFDDPRFALRIAGAPTGIFKIDPLLLVDHHLRRPEGEKGVNIGKIHQMPQKLAQHVVNSLKIELRNSNPNLPAGFFGEE